MDALLKMNTDVPTMNYFDDEDSTQTTSRIRNSAPVGENSGTQLLSWSQLARSASEPGLRPFNAPKANCRRISPSPLANPKNWKSVEWQPEPGNSITGGEASQPKPLEDSAIAWDLSPMSSEAESSTVHTKESHDVVEDLSLPSSAVDLSGSSVRKENNEVGTMGRLQ